MLAGHPDRPRRHDLPRGGCGPRHGHAAAVVGCGELKIDEEAKTLTVAGKVYHEGDFISLDGSTGNVYDEPDCDR